MEFYVNENENQFEIDIDGQIAFIEFSREANKIYLTHTEVPQSLRGRGIGSKIIKQSLEYIKNQNLTLIPLCSFVAHYVNNHPEWHSLLGEGYKM